MSINRKQLVSRHNPVLKIVDRDSPLTIGNGEFAFTADITGLQTLYESYKENHVPLCTMSQWGWHTSPVEKYKGIYNPNGGGEDIQYYKEEDVLLTDYDFAGRIVSYATDKKPGNEEAYEWLRENPHRFNLGRLAFLYNGKEIKMEDISGIRQELNLYEGIIESRFSLQGTPCFVRTACHGNKEMIGVSVKSEALEDGKLQVYLVFPYGSPDITASDFTHPEYHTSEVIKNDERNLLIERNLDREKYYVEIKSGKPMKASRQNKHGFLFTVSVGELDFTLCFTKEIKENKDDIKAIFLNSSNTWKDFWEKGGAIDLHRSKDERALELERRIILSQYLSAIQSCGSMPPQETGLTCNSWYGKFHLEMYLLHCGYLPLWKRTPLLERSLLWYKDTLKIAKKNAAKNDYTGARWPKMVAYDAIDSPSSIATLLIWQQPHIIYMLEMAYNSEQERGFLEEYWEVVKETAEFMADYALLNPDTGKYDLHSPIIPAQEEHDPKLTMNPTFEVEYWRFALNIAVKWAERLGKECRNWRQVAENMADLPVKDGLYLAHENCPDTFERFNKDHPSMLAAYGLIESNRISKEFMKNTLKKILECWDFSSMWGWDFAMMAMTAVRLGDAKTAIEILLKDAPKNSYVASGNNFQKLRTDLPLYLPGNGSLLLAIPIMAAGYKGCMEKLPGFPKDGMWTVEYESILPFPY